MCFKELLRELSYTLGSSNKEALIVTIDRSNIAAFIILLYSENQTRTEGIFSSHFEESEDSDDDMEGCGHAVRAFQYGDAHGPDIVTDIEGTRDLAEVRVQKTTDEVDVQEDAVINCPTGEQTDLEPVDRDESVNNFHTGPDTGTTDGEREIVSDTEDLEKDRKDASKDVEYEDGTVEENLAEGDKEEAAKKPVPLPRPPRRSTRPRKPPDKYKDYVMYRMPSVPVDRKLQAMQTLMNSGVLEEVDSDMAHALMHAIMN